MVSYHLKTRHARRLIAKGEIDLGLDELAALAEEKPTAVHLRILARFLSLTGRTERLEGVKSRLQTIGIEAYGDDLQEGLEERFARDTVMRGILGYALRTPDISGARLYMRWLRGRSDEAQRILVERGEKARTSTNRHDAIVNHAACVYAAMSLGDLDQVAAHALEIRCDALLLSLPGPIIDFVMPCLWVRPHSVRQAKPIWSRRLRKPTDGGNDTAARHPLVLVEGAFAPETAARIIAEAYPEARALSISFMTRPAGMIDRFQSYFAQDNRWSCAFPDLLIDFTGNYSPFIRIPSALAGEVSERAFNLMRRSVGWSERALCTLFEEPLTLSFDDHVYRYLRVARALEGLLASGRFDRVLVISATGTYMYAALVLARQKLGVDAVQFSLLGRSPPLQTRLAGTARNATLGRVISEEARDRAVALNQYQRRYPFSRTMGPVVARPILYRLQVVRMWATTVLQKLNPRFWIRQRDACLLLQGNARFVNARPTELPDFRGCSWIAANLDDRVYGPVAYQLLVHLPRNAPIVFVDYSPPDSLRTAQVLGELDQQGRRLAVINYRDLMKTSAYRWQGLGRYRKLRLASLFPAGWRKLFPMALGETAMRHFLTSPLTSILRTVAPLHLNVGWFAWAATSYLKAERLFIFPTRNTYMRVFAQGARLSGTPSFEVQAVLGGRMVRHRLPNTDTCSVLETWSRDYFVSYLGFPRERLLCGGSERYDALLGEARRHFSDDTVAAVRRQAAGADPRPIILFGTQPMQMDDNLVSLANLMLALHGRTDVQVVIKLHPAEPRGNSAVYEQAAERHGGATRVRVVQDIAIYPLILASKVVVAQTSNILIEAALLERRAIALQFLAFEPPIDFEDMGCARVMTTRADLSRELDDVLSAPPGQARVDTLQDTFRCNNAQMLDEKFVPRIIAHGLGLKRRGFFGRFGQFLADLRAPLR